MNTQHQAQNAVSIVMGLNILLGLVLCFTGYLISKIRIALGVLLGFAIAANIGFSVSQNPWMAFVTGIIGGVVGALVSTVFYFLGLFLIGALLGGFLSSTSIAFATHSNPQPWIVSVFALLGGLVVLLFRNLRVAVVLTTTALGGAALMVFGILCLTLAEAAGGLSWPDVFSSHGKLFSYAISAGWIVLAASGIVVQYKLLPVIPAEIPPPLDIPPGD